MVEDYRGVLLPRNPPQSHPLSDGGKHTGQETPPSPPVEEAPSWAKRKDKWPGRKRSPQIPREPASCQQPGPADPAESGHSVQPQGHGLLATEARGGQWASLGCKHFLPAAVERGPVPGVPGSVSKRPLRNLATEVGAPSLAGTCRSRPGARLPGSPRRPGHAVG